MSATINQNANISSATSVEEIIERTKRLLKESEETRKEINQTLGKTNTFQSKTFAIAN